MFMFIDSNGVFHKFDFRDRGFDLQYRREKEPVMDLKLHIPDELAGRLSAGGGDLSRRALEALAAEEYRHNRHSKAELQLLLGIETSFQLDEFLKAHDVWIEYTEEDAERERKGFQRLGL